MVRNLGGHGWKKRLSVRSWRFREWRGLRNLLFARSGGRTGQRLDRLGLPADHGPGTVRGVEPEDVLYPGLEVLDQAGGPGVDLGRSIGEHALLLVRGRKWFGAEHLRGSARGNREAGTAQVSARRGKKQATRGGYDDVHGRAHSCDQSGWGQSSPSSQQACPSRRRAERDGGMGTGCSGELAHGKGRRAYRAEYRGQVDPHGTWHARTAISMDSLVMPGPCAGNLIETALAEAYANSGIGGTARQASAAVCRGHALDQMA